MTDKTNIRFKYHYSAMTFKKDLEPKSPLNAVIQEVISDLEAKQVKLNSMYAKHDELGLGLIYQNKIGQYGFVLPDASAQGKYRYQLFDAQGFFTHSTHSTLDEAIYHLCDEGFTTLADQSILETLSATTLWKFKTEALALRTAVQDGIYTWEQGDALYLELRKKHYPDEAA